MKRHLMITVIACALVMAGCADANSSSSSEKTDSQQQSSSLADSSSEVSAAEPDGKSEKYPTNAPEQWKSEVKVEGSRITYGSFDELEKASDLIVIGEYAENTRQYPEYEQSSEFGKEILVDCVSKNTIKVEKVLKGEAVQSIKISQRYGISETDCELVAFTGLTPMKKGDRWIFFLQYDKQRDTYWVAGDHSGRYPLPDEKLRGLCSRMADYNEELNKYVKENNIDLSNVKPQQQAGLAKFDEKRQEILNGADKNVFGVLDAASINLSLYGEVLKKFGL